jgi:hypothetical protein
MYPLLIGAFAGQARKFSGDILAGKYPEEVVRPHFELLPILSFCRRQAMEAIRATGALDDYSPDQLRNVRWRASVPVAGRFDLAHESRLCLFVDNEDGTPRLVYDAPLCGQNFDALPLVLRLGLELLIRKECNGADPE